MGVDSVDLDFFGLRAFLGLLFGVEDPWMQMTNEQSNPTTNYIFTWAGGLLLFGDIGDDVESELFLFRLFTFLC